MKKNDENDKNKNIKFYAVLSLLIIFAFFILFTALILADYDTVMNILTGNW